MTKDEFILVVEKFNKSKIEQLWIDKFLNVQIGGGWKVVQPKILPYFSEYIFNNMSEFRYWLRNSEKDTFITERFCPVCGAFIEVSEKGFDKVYRTACCKEHIEKLRLEKIAATCIKLYGFACPAKSKAIRQKIEQTNLEKYGVKYPLQDKEIYKKTMETGHLRDSYRKGSVKAKATKLRLYGDENYNNKESISQTKQNWTDEQRQKYIRNVKATKLERYGNENYQNMEKIKQTNLERYGYENPSYSPMIKEKIAKNAVAARVRNHTTQKELIINEEYKQNFINKVYATKKKNHTFKTSKPEKEILELLKIKFPEVKYQYKSDEYPFNCDFYIPEYNLYIEYQGHWTHNFKPFENTKEDLEKIERWKNKNTKLYKTAIEVWTVRDPLKRATAKKNNLNWIEFFSMKEFRKWYDELSDTIFKAS